MQQDPLYGYFAAVAGAVSNSIIQIIIAVLNTLCCSLKWNSGLNYMYSAFFSYAQNIESFD